MNLLTLARFLVGDRKAILDVAAGKHALWLGLIFVLSAGLAREYDGEDLLHEPWHLAIPLVASLGSSIVLFLLVELAAWMKGVEHASIVARYRAFLQVFWMTAPLAWLYAIPFERFLSPADAVRANLSLLSLVAAWRVVLITRAISVLYRAKYHAALAVVLLYADTVALIVLFMTPIPIVGIMGGIRHSESELVIRSVTVILTLLGTLSWIFWLGGAVAAVMRTRWTFRLPMNGSNRSIHLSVWALAGLSLAAWALVLPFTQPEQQNRRQAERLLRQGQIEEGLQFLSARRRKDFPPHWDVPPRLGYGESVPDLLKIVETAIKKETAPWVRQVFIDKLEFQSPRGEDNYEAFFSPILRVDQMSDDELRRAIATLKELPEGAVIAASRRKLAEHTLESEQDLSPERRALIEEFLRLAQRE